MAGVQTFTETLRQEILFSDTEGLDFRDMNDMQRLVHREYSEKLLTPWIWEPGELNTTRLRPIRRGLELQDGPSGLQFKIRAGSVIFRIDDPGDAGTPGVAGYGMVVFRKESDTTITADAADPTNPRWDIVSAKVEILSGDSQTRKRRLNPTVSPSSASFNKARQYRLTLTYTPGTPAGSPAEPSVPSGEFKIARIQVPALASNLDPATDLLDFRRPAGMRAWPIPNGLMHSNTFTQDADGVWNSAGAGNILRIPLQIPEPLDYFMDSFRPCRLQQLNFVYKLSAGSTVRIRYRDGVSTGAPSWTTVLDLSASLTLDNTTRLAQFVDTGGLNVPVWSSGLLNARQLVSPILVLEVTANAASNAINSASVGWWGA